MAGERKKTGNGPGWGGPAKGAGWGGPASGSRGDKPAKAWTSEYRPASNAPKNPGGPSRAQLKEERSKALEDLLYDLAMTNDNPHLRVSAATKLHSIYNGQPVARQVSTTVDDVSKMSDEELRTELSRLRIEQEGPKATDSVN